MKLTVVSNRSPIQVVLALLTVSLSSVSCSHHVEQFRNADASGGILKGPTLNVHSSFPRYLTIKGQTFTSVRGSAPFYLTLTNLNAVLFVTEDFQNDTTFHVLSLETGRSASIFGGKSDFGARIGFPSSPGDKYSDWIESASTNRVVVSTRAGPFKTTTVLNLSSASVERIDFYYLNAQGVPTNKVSYPPPTKRH